MEPTMAVIIYEYPLQYELGLTVRYIFDEDTRTPADTLFISKKTLHVHA